MVFTEAGIDLSFNQVVIQNYTPTDYKTSKKKKEDAQNFVNEQKELSKDLESNESLGN